MSQPPKPPPRQPQQELPSKTPNLQNAQHQHSPTSQQNARANLHQYNRAQANNPVPASQTSPRPPIARPPPHMKTPTSQTATQHSKTPHPPTSQPPPENTPQVRAHKHSNHAPRPNYPHTKKTPAPNTRPPTTNHRPRGVHALHP